MGSQAFESASKLEGGTASATQNSPMEEKSVEPYSPTLAAPSTLRSGTTVQSTISTLKRAQSWAAQTGTAFIPRINKENIKTNVAELESYSIGYPRLACYLDSDDAFMMYRRFGILHSRLLLHKQDKLRELESELFTSDKQDEKTEDGKLCLRSREEEESRDDAPRGRRKHAILDDINEALIEYGTLLKQSQDLNCMNKPHSRDHHSVVNFISNHQPLVEDERGWAYHREDLVSLRQGRENAWLDAAVEAFLRWYPCRPIKRIFCTEDQRRKSIDPHIHYFSRARINFVVTLIITFLILILLVAPIVGLFELTQRHDFQQTDAVCIGILLVSTLVFSSVLSMFTKAKRHEVLAAAAAYCAVLVVFVGNIRNS